jgi:glycosyltransferase involved in cell wall biosynthesis
VNEAMNFNLPLIVSDSTGCVDDLVRENGVVFKTGDVMELSQSLERLLYMDNNELRTMGIKSSEIVKEYSYERIIMNLKNNLAV